MPLIEALYDLSAVSRILTMNCETGKVYVSLPEEKSMYLIFQIRTIGLGTRREEHSSSRFERYCRRSQSDLFKDTKKKEKAEADKIGKNAPDSIERAGSRRL